MKLTIADQLFNVAEVSMNPAFTNGNQITLSVAMSTRTPEQLADLKRLGETLQRVGAWESPFQQGHLDQAQWQRFYVVDFNPALICENEWVLRFGNVDDDNDQD